MVSLARISLAAAFLSGIAALSTPTVARACGGTFCDGANGVPVNQTGETIVFALDGGFVEAHVQINYEGGDASDFSWIVPVPEVPEIGIGSLQFIEDLRNSTVPSYGLTQSFDCDDPAGSASGIGFISRPDGGGSSIDSDGPEVLALSTAGAFDYVLLQGGTADTMMEWLENNGYAPNPVAPALFDHYIDSGSVFVAFKLTHSAGIEDLHPIVIRYQGTEPCIPLRLTAVAAEDDMHIRAFFLGESRVLPTNYKHVSINSARLDWLQFAPDYPQAVSKALDEAGGRAFTTEYAGTTDVVPIEGLDTSTFNANDFASIDPLSVVDTLIAQGLMSCTDTCQYNHELVPFLLREFVPPPEGVDPDTFYACLSCNERLVDTSAWDATAFQDRYREYIRAPMNHALDLLDTWPYLTRLYTRMSPNEMTVDPMFAEVEGLGVVPHILGARQNNGCCDTRVELPNGDDIVIGDGAWPQWGPDMPYAAVIQEYQPAGPPSIEQDNRPAIASIISAHNAAIGCDGGTTGGDTESGGDTEPGSDSNASGGGGSNGGSASASGSASGAGSASGGTGGSAGGSGGGIDDDGGCNVSVGSPRSGGWMLALLGLLAWRRRS